MLRGLYAPGPTIKPQVAIAGLDAGIISLDSKIYDPGYYQLPNYDHKFLNWNPAGDGWVDLNLAIARSNDVYFYETTHRLGIDRLHDYLSKFGIGEKRSLDISEEAAGLMPSENWKRLTRHKSWYPGETLILGIGQGYMQVTPLQLASATSLIASKGVWHRSRLALNIGGQALVDEHPVPNLTLHDPKQWEIINKAMQGVLHSARGVARKVAVGAQYRIAGKSGTAQVVAIRQGERYNRLKPRKEIETTPCSSALLLQKIRR